jgi:hypothetical protein
MFAFIQNFIKSYTPTVDSILSDFHTAIAKLEAAEQREVKKLEVKASQIIQLEAQKVGHALESERAKAIRAKLEALVK